MSLNKTRALKYQSLRYFSVVVKHHDKNMTRENIIVGKRKPNI